MRLTEKQLRTLRPSEGCVLTQNMEVPDTQRVFTGLIHLGGNDAPENWKEVTTQEAEEFMARVRREQEEKAAKEEVERRRKELEAALAELDRQTE